MKLSEKDQNTKCLKGMYKFNKKGKDIYIYIYIYKNTQKVKTN